MDLGINGRVALVLGAGGGLGSAVAFSLAECGAIVAAADVDATSVGRVTDGISQRGFRATPFVWDIADEPATDARIGDVEDALGAVEILVNITGGPPPTAAAAQEPRLWRSNFEMMVLSVIRVSDRVLPGMQARGWGRIITSASSGVISPIPSLGISNALRLTLLGWSKTLAREVAASGVTVNVIVPGRIATRRVEFLDEEKARREFRPIDEVRAGSVAGIPMGRYGRPEEYADVIAFLASDRASYITGSVIRVDGGMIACV